MQRPKKGEHTGLSCRFRGCGSCSSAGEFGAQAASRELDHRGECLRAVEAVGAVDQGGDVGVGGLGAGIADGVVEAVVDRLLVDDMHGLGAVGSAAHVE